jgi:D-alanyl-D-alanine dipeptidase
MINVTSLRSAYLLICQGRWLRISALWLGLVCGSAHADDAALVDLAAALPTIVVEARYAGSHNFVGVPIEGYLDARVLLTQPAVEALGAVQAGLVEFGLGIKVFDGYRPQRAVDHFVRWASDLNDLATKAEFYPQV